MNDDGQTRDDGNKTLMFDPAQTEAFKKMARLARQQSEQAPGQSPTAPAMPVFPGAPGPQMPQATPQIDEGSANKTMMLGAAELAQLRAKAVPAPAPLPARPAAPATIAIDPTKTVPLSAPSPAPLSSTPTGAPSELDALKSGLDAALGGRTNVVQNAPVPGGTQMFSPGAIGLPMGGNETVAYSPEQMAKLRGQVVIQTNEPVGSKTMLYDASQNAEMKEAFELLKRHQALETERQNSARAEAEALLRGVGDEMAPPAAQPVVTQPTVSFAAPQPVAPQSPVHSAPLAASPLASKTDPLMASRQPLPLTGIPLQPRSAVTGGTARFETGTPRKSGAGKAILVILLLAAGAALVAGGLHWAEVITIPFLPKF